MQIAEENTFDVPHILYHVFIIALVKLLPFLSYINAGLIVSLGYCIATPVILYQIVRSALSGIGWRPSLLAGLVTVALLLVTNINLLTLQQQDLYFGYIPINIYHNPTIFVLKPFALLTFVFTLAVLENRIVFRLVTALMGAIIVFLCIFAKPNYLISFLPASILIAGYRWLRREPLPWQLFLFGIVVPATLLIGIQYLMTFGGNNESRVIFAPLAWMNDTSVNLIPKFLLSTLFPLSIYLLYWSSARNTLALNLSWLSFVFGAAQVYLFVETGERMAHGNFLWSAQITLFILFVCSTIFWLKQNYREWRWWVSAVIFMLHLVSGIIFLVYTLTPSA